MFDKLRTFFRRQPAQTTSKLVRVEDLFGGLLNGVETSKLADYESFLRVGTGKLWASWKACDIVAKVFLDTPVKTVRKGSETAVENKELSGLMAAPNEFWSWSEMLYLWVAHIKLTGNAYWLKDETNLAGDRPKRLIPLNPKSVTLTIDPRRGLIGYIYRVNGIEIPYEVNEVIHFRVPHADDPFYGLGEIEAGQPMFQDAINRQDWANQFWKNGASPSGLLVCKTQVMDAEQWEKAKRQWQAQYGGTKNSGKTAWLTGDWDYIKLGLTAAEMQNIEQSQWSIEQIFHVHGVPLSVAGIREASNYATARIEDLAFRRYTIKPLIKLFTDVLQTDLVNGFDPSLILIAEVSGLTDSEAVTSTWVPLFDRGAISLNELREKAGLQAKDDVLFEQHFINAGLVPLDLAGVADRGATDEAARNIVARFTRESLQAHRNGST